MEIEIYSKMKICMAFCELKLPFWEPNIYGFHNECCQVSLGDNLELLIWAKVS